jgi:hypothetical protein
MLSSLSKGFNEPGSGQNPVIGYGGLRTVSGATARNYGNWPASTCPSRITSEAYPHRKVWREGLEVAIKIKGSQGHRRVEWLKQEHPFTAISA